MLHMYVVSSSVQDPCPTLDGNGPGISRRAGRIGLLVADGGHATQPPAVALPACWFGRNGRTGRGQADRLTSSPPTWSMNLTTQYTRQ